MAAVLGGLMLVACSPGTRDEAEQAGMAADTMITTRQEVDTSIITYDTTVDVDTTRREGDRPISRDTLEGADAGMTGSDTTTTTTTTPMTGGDTLTGSDTLSR